MVRTFAIACLVGFVAAKKKTVPTTTTAAPGDYTPLPAYVKSLPNVNGVYDCGNTCSPVIKAQLADKAYRSPLNEGWHDAAGWTPWVMRDAPTGQGDIESYEALNQKHNLCGRNQKLGGFYGAIGAECTTLDGKTPAQAGQQASCGVAGLTCLNADNQKCFGADKKCAAANTATGVNRHGISNQEDQCKEHAVAHGCHWGCFDYKVRFQCEKSWTKAPTPVPTAFPTPFPTAFPTPAPTPFPTPAPSPSGLSSGPKQGDGGLMAAKGLEFHSAESYVTNADFTEGSSAWLANLEGTVVKTHHAAGKFWMTVKSSQKGDTPGVYQYLDMPGRDTFKAGERYLVLIKGMGGRKQWAEKWSAKPFVECEVGGQRRQMLSAQTAQLPPADGTLVDMFEAPSTATKCRAGVLFYGTQPTSEMTIEHFEVRPMVKFEQDVFAADLADRKNGKIANHDFGQGSAFWGRINDRDEVWNNGQDLVVWNHGRPAGQHTGVQQTGVQLEADKKFTFSMKGQVKRNGAAHGDAVLFVSKTTVDKYGNTKTDDITSSVGKSALEMRLSTQGATTVSIKFQTPPVNDELKQVTFNVGARFDGHTPSGVEMFLSASQISVDQDNAEDIHLTTAAEKAYHAELDAKRVARGTQKCECDPRIHSSKATKCYSSKSGFAERSNVIKVVHRRSMLAPETFENIGADQADAHHCEMVDDACKCCDCKDGQKHGFNLASLKDGRKFTVRFDRTFANEAGGVKPGMTGTCRFKGGKWCCSCTNSWLGDKGDKVNNRCPHNYGDEYCYAYSGQRNPAGINFWGRDYHFKEYHRCVTPSMHHNCGENVQAKDKSQDIGHLPYFDNNGVNQWDGFAIVNNAEELKSTLPTYTKVTDQVSQCGTTATATQVGGLNGNQVLTADTCAALCDNDVECKAFNFKQSTGSSKTTCDFIKQVGAGCLVAKQGSAYYVH